MTSLLAGSISYYTTNSSTPSPLQHQPRASPSRVCPPAHPQPAPPAASALLSCWSSLVSPGTADPAGLCTSSPTHLPTRKSPQQIFFSCSQRKFAVQNNWQKQEDQSRGHTYRAEVNDVQVPLLSLGLAFLPGFLGADFSHWQQTSHAEACFPDQRPPAKGIEIKNLYSTSFLHCQPTPTNATPS